MAFGKEIKRLRDAANISAQVLADRIGIDAERLRKWEARNQNPRQDDTALIEAYFGLSIKEIMALDKLPNVQKVLKIDDAVNLLLKNQFKLMAYTRVILGEIAELQAPLKKKTSDQLKDQMIQRVDDELAEMGNEL